MLENRPALALSFVFIVYLHYMGLAVSTIIVKCRSKLFLSSVLFNTFMQKHKDRRGLGWAPVLTKSRQLKPSHARDWATVASLVVWAKWPINRNASEDKHCLMKEFFVWNMRFDSPHLCEREPYISSSSSQSLPIFPYQTGASQGDCIQSHHHVWQAFIQFQVARCLIC